MSISFDDPGGLLRVEVREDERDGLRVLAARARQQHIGRRLPQAVQADLGELALDPIEDHLGASVADRLLEHLARVVHPALRDRVDGARDVTVLLQDIVDDLAFDPGELGGDLAGQRLRPRVGGRGLSMSSLAECSVPSTMHRTAHFWPPVSSSGWRRRGDGHQVSAIQARMT